MSTSLYIESIPFPDVTTFTTVTDILWSVIITVVKEQVTLEWEFGHRDVGYFYSDDGDCKEKSQDSRHGY